MSSPKERQIAAFLRDGYDSDGWAIVFEDWCKLHPLSEYSVETPRPAPVTGIPSLSKLDLKKMSPAELRQAMKERPQELAALGYPVLRGSLEQIQAKNRKKEK